jgi:hypothetical protein
MESQVKKTKKISRMLSESQVREFRENNDATEFLDWSKLEAVATSSASSTKSTGRRGRTRKRTRTASVAN